MRESPYLLGIVLTSSMLLVGCQQEQHGKIKIKSSRVRLEVSDPMQLPIGNQPGIQFGDNLLVLPDKRLAISRGKISITSSDFGSSWQPGPPLPSGRVLPLRNKTYHLQKTQAHPGDGPGLFTLEWTSLASLESVTSDNPITWSKSQVRLDQWTPMTADNETEIDFLSVRGPLLELENGTLLAASYGNFKGDTIPMVGFPASKNQKWFKYRTYLLSSSDRGKNWKYLSTIAYDGKTGQESFCEPALVNLGEGELLAVMRTGRFAPMFQTRSLDGGQSWQKPESTHHLGLAPQMILLENGALVCSFGWRRMKRSYGHGLNDESGPYPAAARDYQNRYRDDVGIDNPSNAAGDYVMVSLDKGETWSKPWKIADPLTSGYTLLAPSGPDHFLVISRRLTLPEETTENLYQKWETDWPESSKRAVLLLEARHIRVRQ